MRGFTRRSGAAFAIVLAAMVAVSPTIAAAAVTVSWDLTWGSQGMGEGQFYYPSDVATDKWGNVFVAGGEDDDHRIQMFDPEGTFVRSVGTTGAATSVLQDPRTVATDRWGTVYVGEKGNGARVSVFFPQLYGKSGTFDGSGSSAITNPIGLAVGLDGTVYLSDGTTVVQRWSTPGTFLGSWTPYGGYAFGVGVSQENEVYTTTDLLGTYPESAIVYGPLGDFHRMWGGNGTGAGQFLRPYDIGVDPLGNSYVVESLGNRGQVFDPDGEYLSTFGSPGGGDDEFNGAYGISVGPDRTVYVTNMFNHRISKWNVEVSTETTSLAGASRYLTAIEASKKAYPDGADAVLVATGANWPDALGGAALAGVVDGPLLLTPGDSLPDAVRDEIVRLGAVSIYVLGGESAVSDTVYDQLDALSILHEPVRLGGADRYATANLIAEESVRLSPGFDGTAFVVTGENFADALSVSPVAAANGWPIYLTRSASLPPSVLAGMVSAGVTHGYIVGGPAAVAQSIQDQLNDDFAIVPGVDMFERYEGATRYETSAVFAETAWNGMGMSFSRPAIATGQNYPDALAGGVLQGTDYCPLLLTPTASLDPDVEAVLADHSMQIYEMRFLGGTAALSQGVRDSVGALLQ